MKRKYVWLSVLLLLLAAGCSKSDEPTHAKEDLLTECEFLMEFSDPSSRTEQQERSVGRLNFFLFDSDGRKVYTYGHTITNKTKVKPGRYTLGALANVDDISGIGSTLSSFLAYRPSFESCLPGSQSIGMSCVQEIEIPYNYGQVFTVQYTLERILAKIEYTVWVAPEVQDDIHLYSFQMCNVPEFVPLRANPDPDYRSWGPFVTIGTQAPSTQPSARYGGGHYFIPENIQGTVPASSTPARRTKDYAPGNATYFLIKAKTARGAAEYRIYLGENDTDDFNVRRNTNKKYSITITGHNPEDYRVAQYECSLLWTESAVPDNFNPDGSFTQQLKVDFTPGINKSLSIKAVCDEGLPGYLTINDKSFIDGECNLWYVGTTRSPMETVTMDYTIRYSPPVYTPENRHFALRFIVTDPDGNVTELPCKYSAANYIRLGSVTGCAQGGVSWFNEIGHKFTGGLSYLFIGDEDNFYLKSTGNQAAGSCSIWEGWYSTPEGGSSYSLEKEFHYIPARRALDIYYYYTWCH